MNKRSLRRVFALSSVLICVTLLASAVHCGLFLYRLRRQQGMFVPNPQTGHSLRPGFEAGPYRINDHGCRGAWRDHPDVLLVGGSTCFGWGVPEADSLAPLLEEHTGLAVVNAAVPYWYSQQELSFLCAVVPQVNPKTVVILSGRNDFAYAARGRHDPLRGVYGMGFMLTPSAAFPEEDPVAPFNPWPENMQLALAAAPVIGVRVIVIRQPMLGAYEERVPPGVIDGSSWLDGHPRPEAYLDDCHYTPRGNRILAEKIALVLTEETTEE